MKYEKGDYAAFDMANGKTYIGIVVKAGKEGELRALENIVIVDTPKTDDFLRGDLPRGYLSIYRKISGSLNLPARTLTDFTDNPNLVFHWNLGKGL